MADDLKDVKPGAIAEAAIEDVRRYFRNKARGREIAGKTSKHGAHWEQYAFARLHVHEAIRKMDGARSLIQLAIDFPVFGRVSSKPTTRMIYDATDLLKQAIEIVDERIKDVEQRTAVSSEDRVSHDG
jgi:hypothetical protein